MTHRGRPPQSGPPNLQKCAVALPIRKPNAAYRSREHLTEREVEKLIETAKDNRWGHRDATMMLLAFRHGLRASELVDLRWEQADLENAFLHVRRVKQGTPATHPLTGREIRTQPFRSNGDRYAHQLSRSRYGPERQFPLRVTRSSGSATHLAGAPGAGACARLQLNEQESRPERSWCVGMFA